MKQLMHAESCQGDKMTECMAMGETENRVKKEVIFNFFLFCMSSYGAMIASISIF
jgi:hypothetical protein